MRAQKITSYTSLQKGFKQTCTSCLTHSLSFSQLLDYKLNTVGTVLFFVWAYLNVCIGAV